jgi:hypothetical protein
MTAMASSGATFAGSVELMLPHLAPMVSGGATVSALIAAAHSLPAIPRGGFECRLYPDSPQVDLHQNVWAADGEPARLAEHVARLLADAPGCAHPAWRRLLHFCREWSDPSSAFHTHVREVWLECDLGGVPLVETSPSVFVGLSHRGDTPWDAAQHTAERLLGEPLPESTARQLQRCFDACPGGAQVSHLGVMASRPSALRINVRRLGAAHVMSYLRDVDWPGSCTEVEPVVDWVLASTDRTTVCLDVDAGIGPALGLECSFAWQPDAEPRWAALFDGLAARGWCTEQKRDALLGWPGESKPFASADPWPAPLLVESLLKAPHQLGLFSRRLSHVKLAYRPGRGWETKGYLLFGHGWVDAATPANLDAFYSSEDIATWKAIIGNDLHYHFGHFQGQEDADTGGRQAVREFYDAIPVGATVLDAGCGWGGPARMLETERQCRVEGVTISRAQAEYCRSLDLNVRCADLERDELPGHFDVAFMLESLEHIRDKQGLLRRLRACADRLVLEINCFADVRARASWPLQFGASMHMRTVPEICEIVESAGWRIRAQRNRRPHSMRSLELWLDALQRMFGAAPAPGQFGALRSHVEHALAAPDEWAHNNPLLVIVAE